MPGERAAELVARTDRELWEELMEVAFDGKQADGRPLADLGAALRESASFRRWPVGEPPQSRESACELGASGNGVHGAYLNGWLNSSSALTRGTPNTVRVAVRASRMTIWVCPVSRFHSSQTVKPSLWRVSSSTNTAGICLASVLSPVVGAGPRGCGPGQCSGSLRGPRCLGHHRLEHLRVVPLGDRSVRGIQRRAPFNRREICEVPKFHISSLTVRQACAICAATASGASLAEPLASTPVCLLAHRGARPPCCG